MSSLLLRSKRRLIISPISLLRSYSLQSNTINSAATAAAAEDLQTLNQRTLPSDYNPSTFDPTEHRTPPSARVWRLVDEISSLTLSDVTDLSSILMRKASLNDPPLIGLMNPFASFPSAVALASGVAAQEEEKPEKTVFELKLESFEVSSKIRVIKEVRGFTDLGLKEAKELVEKSPAVIKSGVSKEEAEGIIEKMKGAGAKVVMV